MSKRHPPTRRLLPKSAAKPAASPAVAGYGLHSLSLAVALSLGAASVGAQTGGSATGISGHTNIHGTVTPTTVGTHTQISTTNGAGTNHSVANWQSFSVAAGHSAHIDQPNNTSLSINRVVGNNPSAIFGQLSSNGKVLVVNPSGITVGAGAVVDTAGFTASVLDMSVEDAIAGRLRFGSNNTLAAPQSGVLRVDGHVIARGGDVVLVAPEVHTGAQSLIQTPGGTTILAAGQKAEITGRGLEGITMQVQAPSDQAITLGRIEGDAVGIFAGTLKHSGLIRATAADMQGGRVVLRASGDNLVSGQIDVSSASGQGGSVDVLGNRVGLLAGADINASGATGGGNVRIGGDYQGKNASIPNALRTYFDQTARIAADATQTGHGGKVILWADGSTRAYGTVSARGGAQGGDGGFVEISGKERLDFYAKVDTRAPKGKTGTLLLDPDDIEITTSAPIAPLPPTGTPGEVGYLFEPPTATALQINPDAINTATTNVILQANNDINVNSAIDIGAANVGLTMQAGGFLNVNADITTNGGAVNLVSGDPGSLTNPNEGSLNIGNGVSIQTGGGNISLTANLSDVGGNSLAFGDNVVLNAGTGNISLTGQRIETTNTTANLSITGNSVAMQTNAANSSITLQDTTINASSVLLQTNSDGSTINLTDSTVNASGTLFLRTIGLQSHIRLINTNLASQNNAQIVANQGQVLMSGGRVTGPSSLLISGNAAASSGLSGVDISGGAVLERTGDITIDGTSEAFTGVSISGYGTQINAGGSNITITGTTDVDSFGVLIAGALLGAPVPPPPPGPPPALPPSAAVQLQANNITITGTSVPGPTPVGSDVRLQRVDMQAANAMSITGNSQRGIEFFQVGGVANENRIQVNNPNGLIKLTADSLRIGPGFNVNAAATGSAIEIQTKSATRRITLGGTDENNNLNITNAEIQQLSAPTLRIGSASHTADIDQEGSVTLLASNNLSLLTTGNVRQIAGASITADALRVEATTIVMNSANTPGTIALRSTGGGIVYNSAGAFNIGTVDSLSGLSGGNNNVNLGSGDAITQSQAITGVNQLDITSGGGIFLGNAGNTIAQFGTVINNANNVELRTAGNPVTAGAPTKFLNINNDALNANTTLISDVSTELVSVVTTGNGRIQAESGGDLRIGNISSNSSVIGNGLATASVGLQAAGSIDTLVGQNASIATTGGGSVFLKAGTTGTQNIGNTTTDITIGAGPVTAFAQTGSVNLKFAAGSVGRVEYVEALGDVNLIHNSNTLQVNRVMTQGDVRLTGTAVTISPSSNATDALVEGASVTISAGAGNVTIGSDFGKSAQVRSLSGAADSILINARDGLEIFAGGGNASLVAVNGGINLGAGPLRMSAESNSGAPGDAVILALNGNITAPNLDAPGACPTNNCFSLPFNTDPFASPTAYTGLLAQNYFSRIRNNAQTFTVPFGGGAVNPLPLLPVEVVRGDVANPLFTDLSPGFVITPTNLPPGVSFSGNQFVIGADAAPGTYALSYDVVDPVRGLSASGQSVQVIKQPAPITTPVISTVPNTPVQIVTIPTILTDQDDDDGGVVVSGQTCPR